MEAKNIKTSFHRRNGPTVASLLLHQDVPANDGSGSRANAKNPGHLASGEPHTSVLSEFQGLEALKEESGLSDGLFRLGRCRDGLSLHDVALQFGKALAAGELIREEVELLLVVGRDEAHGRARALHSSPLKLQA